MTPVSGVNAKAIQALTETEKTLGAQKVQNPQEENPDRPLRPGKDQYLPEEKPEPIGRY